MIFLLEIRISTRHLTELCWCTPENRAGCSRGGRGEGWGACSALVCHSAASLHSTTLKTSKNFLQRLTLPHSSIFLSDFVLFNTAKWSSRMQCSSYPNSHWGKWYRHWKAFWQLPAPLTGFHSTRKSCHLFLGWTTDHNREMWWHNSHCYPALPQN